MDKIFSFGNNNIKLTSGSDFMFRGKIVVVGAGFVGSTIAYTLMLGGLFSEIVLIDLNREKAEGEALDIGHGAVLKKPVNVFCGDYSECRNADIIVITAGVNQIPGESRLALLNANAGITKKITESIMKYAPDDIILLTVSNPVDVLTYITYKVSGLPSNQVIGSGTVLDTSRLKYLIGNKTGIDARSCHSYIIGEHGDSEVAAWSIANIGGMSMKDFYKFSGLCSQKELEEMFIDTKNAAYGIIEKKGATYYAIAVAVERIVECIAGEENSILTVSSVFDGQYGIKDVALSVPTMVGGAGIQKVFEIPLSDEELSGLQKSAESLKKVINELKF